MTPEEAKAAHDRLLDALLRPTAAFNSSQAHAAWLRGQPGILDAKVNPTTGRVDVTLRPEYPETIVANIGFTE